jgi:hypothetical protein
MSIDKVTREEWDKLEELKKEKHDPVQRPMHYQ